MISKVVVYLVTISAVICSSAISETSDNDLRDTTSCDRLAGHDVAFIRLGEYRGQDDDGFEYQKTYFLSRHIQASWVEAKSLCKAFELELASFETKTELQSFMTLCKESKTVTFGQRVWYLVDGMVKHPKSSSDWYWTNTGRKISYKLPWTRGQPDFYGGNEHCLSMGKTNATDFFGFNDFPCSRSTISFICQRVDFYLN